MFKQFMPALVAAFMVASASSLKAQLVGVEFNTGRFYSISPTNGSLQLIDESGILNLGALEFNPQDGFFYGFTSGTGAQLYRFGISPSLDDVTPTAVGPLGLFVAEGGIAFSPSGTAYALRAGALVPELMSLDLATGAATSLGTVVDPLGLLASDVFDFNGLGWRSDGLLIGLDNENDALVVFDPLTRAVTSRATLMAEPGSVGGMAMGEAGNFFVTAGPGAANPGSNSLYSFDPFTGEQVFIASFENQILGTGFSGLTFVPEPATLALLSVGGLALLRRRKAAK